MQIIRRKIKMLNLNKEICKYICKKNNKLHLNIKDPEKRAQRREEEEEEQKNGNKIMIIN